MSFLSRLLRHSFLSGIILILLCSALMLPGLGAGLVTRESELRVLLCARKMAEGGSWLIPVYRGEERLRKPPLMYWITAIAFEAAGSTESETAARASAAAAGTALVLSTFYFGRRLVGRRAAFLGAVALATSIGFVRHARLAETDMAQSLFTSLAIFAAYAALTTRRPLRCWLVCGTAAGTGFMFKGPGSIAMPVAAVVTFALCSFYSRSGRRRQQASVAGKISIHWPGIIAALVVFAAIAAPWYIAVALNTTTATRNQAGDELSRLLVESHHPGPFVYYLYTLPARLGFWALLIPVAVFGAWKKIRHHRGGLLLLAWFASTFVILSALQSKQQHYALLLLPSSALLCGWLLARGLKLPVPGKNAAENFQSLEAANPRRDFYSRYTSGYVRAVCAVIAAACAATVLSKLFPIPADFAPLRDAAVIPAAICGAIGLAGFFWRRQRMLGGLAAISAAYAIMMAAQVLSLEKFQSGFSIAPGLLNEHRDVIQRAKHVFIAGPRSSVLAWYAARDITLFNPDTTSNLWSQAQTGDVLIASDRVEKERIAPQITDVPLARVQHLDTALTVYLKAEAKP